MAEFFAFIVPLLFAAALLRISGIIQLAEKITLGFLAWLAHLVAVGYLANACGGLNSLLTWANISGALFLLLCGLSLCFPASRQRLLKPLLKPPGREPASLWADIRPQPVIIKALLAAMAGAILTIGLLQLLLVLHTAPHNWDSIAAHLARVAYFLQNNSLASFGANYWAQDMHPRNGSLLLLYTYLLTGQENFTQCIQFFAYWVGIAAIYRISGLAGLTRVPALFAGLVFGLLISVLMQASTTQADLLIAVLQGTSVLALLAYRHSGRKRYLLWAPVGFGLSVGIKASAILGLPALFVLGLYCLKGSQWGWAKSWGLATISMLVVASVYWLPTGYLHNVQQYGHPIGTEEVRHTHGFNQETWAERVHISQLNLLRYSMDFLHWDGLPKNDYTVAATHTLQYVPRQLSHALLNQPLDEITLGTRVPFSFQRVYQAHEDTANWGVLGFGLVWLTVLLALWHWRRYPALAILAAAMLVFLLTQAASSPYDPWRGRYFLISAFFAVPTVGLALVATARWWRGYVLGIVVLGVLCAFSAVLLRNNGAILPAYGKPSVFSLNRIEQLSRNRPRMTAVLAAYEKQVPSAAVVAVALSADQYEYPLFGDGLSRTLLPINAHRNTWRVPANADFLLYDVSYPCPQDTDIALGEGWFLRHLTSQAARACIRPEPAVAAATAS